VAAISDVAICNLALGWVGGNLITSLDDEQTEAQLCKANYAILRDALIESVDWTFAMLRAPGGAPLAPDPNRWGYAYAFQLPSSLLRVIYLGLSDRWEEDEPVPDWVREGDKVLTNANTVFVRGVQRIEDPNLFSTLFSQALAARLATDLAIPIAHSRTLQADMAKLYSAKMGDAIAQDAKQGRTRVLRASGMNQARRAGATGIVGPFV
jgi:hypothetical protein